MSEQVQGQNSHILLKGTASSTHLPVTLPTKAPLDQEVAFTKMIKDMKGQLNQQFSSQQAEALTTGLQTGVLFSWAQYIVNILHFPGTFFVLEVSVFWVNIQVQILLFALFHK